MKISTRGLDEALDICNHAPGPNAGVEGIPWEPDANDPDDITEWSVYGFAAEDEEDPDVVIICFLAEDGKVYAEIAEDFILGNEGIQAGPFDGFEDAIAWGGTYYPTDDQWAKYAATLENGWWPSSKPEASIDYDELTDEQRALVDSPIVNLRLAAVTQGYGLDELVDDKDPAVRAEVARQGYGLGRLLRDGDRAVRQVALISNNRIHAPVPGRNQDAPAQGKSI